MALSKKISPNLQRRQIVSGLDNGWTSGPGYYYYLNADIGTPAQSVELIVDTGSSDTWVYGSSLCGTYSCFNEQESSTIGSTDLPGYSEHYTGGSFVQGTFYTDTFSVGGATVQSMDLAVVTSASSGPSTGILGLGFDTSTAPEDENGVFYPTFLDTLYSQGLISSHTFSLYLDDLTANDGAIVFGGYDTAKYTGDIVTFAIDTSTLDVPRTAVPFSGLSITDASGSEVDFDCSTSLPAPAVLDSGTPVSQLPAALFSQVAAYFTSSYSLDTSSGLVSCGLASDSGTLNLGFTDPSSGNAIAIAVPFSELAISNGDGTCTFGIQEQPANICFFGDTFMRSMYIIYDYDHNDIALAQSSFDSGSSNLVAI